MLGHYPRMSEIASIQQLWKEHFSAPFPSGVAGKEVDGECLASLDTFAAGCIDTFLSRRTHTLDSRRLEVLTKCAQSLSRVCPQLPDEHRVYFDRLREISERVLSYCRRDLR